MRVGPSDGATTKIATRSDSAETNNQNSTPDNKKSIMTTVVDSGGRSDNVVGVVVDNNNNNGNDGLDAVHSLGEALAGVTMGTTSSGSSSVGGGGGGSGGGGGTTTTTGSSIIEKQASFASSSPVTTPFALGGGPGSSSAPGNSAQKESDNSTTNDGWGNFAADGGGGSSHHAFAASSSVASSSSRDPAATTSSGSTAPGVGGGGGGPGGSVVGVGVGGPNGSSTSGSAEGLELFLSHSSSQALGDNNNNVFRFSGQQKLSALGNSSEETSNSINNNNSNEQGGGVGSGSSSNNTNKNNNTFLLTAGQTLAPGPATSSSPSFGDLRTASDSRRRTDSPSCSVTGTTTSSRSCSPYTNNSGDVVVTSQGGRVINAYQRYETTPPNTNDSNVVIGRNQPSFAEDDRSSSAYSLSHGHGSHPSLATLDSAAHRSPYAKDRTTNFKGGTGPPIATSPFDSADELNMRSNSYGSIHNNDMMSSPTGPPPQLPPSPSPAPAPAPAPANNGQQPQPQVLYMAVPSPDGRGQVLQPVQMVQLPGKPYHFVGQLGNNGGTPTTGGAPPPVVAAASAAGGDHQAAGGSMMVLPPLPNQHGTPNSSIDNINYPPSPTLQQQQQQATTPLENRSRVAHYAIDTSSNRASSPYSNSGITTPIPTTPTDIYPGSANSGASAGSPAALGGGGTSPYQVDSVVSSLYSSPQRPPLEALLGEVRRLSRDQVGCRLVQQALDEEGPMAATLILNEGLPFWAEAMVDPFGNYLFQKILEKVTSQERVMLVKSVAPRLVNASLNLHGTRSVQKVVEMCSQDEQSGRNEGGEETAADILTNALAPAAARLCIDSHGNHVIQRILLKLGPKHTKFVFDAVAASVGEVARHRHGCCVIQRCLDSPPNEARAHLVRRIVEKSLELMQDAYGNYVVQYVLDVCSDEDVYAVCESVAGKVNLLAIQKFSSNVMEKCLERCSDRVKEMYLSEMSDPERIRELMMDPFGNYVVQRALSVATHAQAIRLVEAMRPHLIATQTQGPHGQRNGGVRNTAGGRRIIAKICRRFPNFTLTAVGTQDELYSSKPNPHAHHHHHQPQQHHHHHHAAAAASRQHHHHLLHPPPAIAAAPGGYSAVVGPPTTPLGTQLNMNYGADPRLAPGHVAPLQQQQQSYYSLGGAPYYDQYGTNSGLGGFPGMEF